MSLLLTSSFSKTQLVGTNFFNRVSSINTATATAALDSVSNIISSIGENQQRGFSTTRKSAPQPEVELKYYVPRAERDRPNACWQFDRVFKDRLVKNTRSCPTRELNYTADHWRKHKDPYRKFRHLTSIFKSSPFRRLMFPDLFVTASIASGVSYYNYFMAEDVFSMLVVDGAAMTGASTAIGLLAAFRLNASYGRYDEGRKFWGEVNNSARDLAGNAMMWLETPEQKDRMLKLIKAFPVILQWHLNEKGGHYLMNRKDPNFKEQKYAEYYAELFDIYENDYHPDFVQFTTAYQNGGHVPLGCASVMRSIIAENKEFGDPIYNREMDEQVQRLVGCLGMCERVLRTPIPTCFTRHTSRLLFAWSNLLPFTMYASLGPFGTLPASLLVSYAVLGIADVGVQLEEPFNILPLRQYSEGMFDGVNAIESNYLLAQSTFQTTAEIGEGSPDVNQVNGKVDTLESAAENEEKTLDGADNFDAEQSTLRSAAA